MEPPKTKINSCLCIRALTWYKDSHSLFDYESSKINASSFFFPLHARSVTVYRKRQSSTVVAYDDTQNQNVDQQEYQLLTQFQLKQNIASNKIKLEFFNSQEIKPEKLNSQRLNTDQSISSYCSKEEETYLIVRKIKDINNEQKGYKLIPGQTIKLGRVEYFVSEIKEGNKIVTASQKSKQTHNYNRNVMKYVPSPNQEKNACKICLEDLQEEDNFLFNPCKCSGSCGTVHFKCLTEWIHFKVKKEVIGGTLHFNFNKFQCQVCKMQLPMVIDVNNECKELLPIQKPSGNYLILQGACQKAKSVMMIQNIPNGGIKLGRGHDCQIRITDISVSRNHALIKNVNNSFYIFDNKSKFGTLVKDEKLSLEIGKISRGVQIGRTALNFQFKRDQPNSPQQTLVRDIKSEVGIREIGNKFKPSYQDD